ncbi:MAG: hypothetical protein ABIB97_03170 [Patescibacteria group bacterium]
MKVFRDRRDVWYFIKDRPTIWLPPLFAVWSVFLMCGFIGFFVHREFVQTGGQENFLGILLPIFAVILGLLFICGLIGMMQGDHIAVGATGGLAVTIGMLVAVVSPFISWYILRLLAPGLLNLPILQALNFQFHEAPYRIFGNVGITGLYAAMIVGPYFAFSLVSIPVHLLVERFQQRRIASSSLQPAKA